ncbi:hypothetical protein GCM10010094_46250 [Streptomyces flaveus]|uniref:Uncharacterized protein n=1 Tax=Streptomyces flaveus TaxID=66370 RepID=A0A917R0L5_9ACTN|nr:hypothetical protein GCM10010094_46250 [Streptomyces flaveus]
MAGTTVGSAGGYGVRVPGYAPLKGGRRPSFKGRGELRDQPPPACSRITNPARSAHVHAK